MKTVVLVLSLAVAASAPALFQDPPAQPEPAPAQEAPPAGDPSVPPPSEPTKSVFPAPISAFAPRIPPSPRC